MPAPATPPEIAREVLKLIAARRIAPTPDNFRKLYEEVAGVPSDEEIFPEKFVRALAHQLPRDTAERQRLARALDQALAEGAPAAAREALNQYLEALRGEAAPAWNELIGNLLRQWEMRQMGWTVARKRESLERVLSANDPITLHARLQGLVRAWSQAPVNPETAVQPETLVATAASPADTPADAPTATTAHAPVPGRTGEFLASQRELLLLALETVIPALLGEQSDLADEAARLAAAVKAAHSTADLQRIGAQLRKFAYRLETGAVDRAEVQAGLLNLFRLLLQNIDQIVVDDRWLHGQLEALREIVDQPANLRLLDDAERRLKDVIYKQSQLKHNLVEAQRAIKDMLADFIDQFARLAESTGSYHDRIGSCAQKIAAAQDITEIGHLLDDVMRETRAIQEQARNSRDELQAARQRAQDAETRIIELQNALDESSRLMRHDQLTGTLNRRGLEESFAKEAARAERRRAPLCVALLDLDHFKQLNDAWGHHTGDDALVHLATVIRSNLRPQDSVARYGGEEFILIYPETTLTEATTALVRLQRELTRSFFLAGDTKLLITFSAGVTDWRPGEDMAATLERADAAMYEAKHNGRNRVVAAAKDAALRE